MTGQFYISPEHGEGSLDGGGGGKGYSTLVYVHLLNGPNTVNDRLLSIC